MDWHIKVVVLAATFCEVGMSTTVYGVGGHRPAHPSLGRVLFADDATSTVTTWNDAGTQTGSRAYTGAETAQMTAEIAQRTAGTNKTTIEQRANAVQTANATYLAIPTPSNAQVAAQVRRNTMAINGLIKILLNQLDDTTGTA